MPAGEQKGPRKAQHLSGRMSGVDLIVGLDVFSDDAPGGAGAPDCGQVDTALAGQASDQRSCHDASRGSSVAMRVLIMGASRWTRLDHVAVPFCGSRRWCRSADPGTRCGPFCGHLGGGVPAWGVTSSAAAGQCPVSCVELVDGEPEFDEDIIWCRTTVRLPLLVEFFDCVVVVIHLRDSVGRCRPNL